MSSKIVFKINGNKDLSEISLVNVQKQLDNLIENINQGILSLKKKKSTVKDKNDTDGEELEDEVKFQFRNLTEHMLQKIIEERESGYIVYLEAYLKLFYELINTNKGYSMGDPDAGQSFIRKINSLTVKIDETIGGSSVFGNIIPLEYLINKNNIENLGKVIENYTYNRLKKVLTGTIITEGNNSARKQETLRNINHDNIRVIGRNKFLYHDGEYYMLKKEELDKVEGVYFKNEKDENKFEDVNKKKADIKDNEGGVEEVDDGMEMERKLQAQRDAQLAAAARRSAADE